jgi:adenylate cyclase
MNDGEGQRKIAAILAADVAGYSRLMADDERATVAALNAARAVFRERIGARGGRVVDTAGDSVLAIFPSVVEAVHCAISVQDALAEVNADVAEDRRMRFRIGVNLGDILEQADGSIYGDGVNIAARLESLAAPGGVMISEAAHMQVRRGADMAFSDAGVHEVKNIPEPVHAFSVATKGAISTPKAAKPKGDPARAEKSSIAVLPFDNMSGEAEQEYFSDGISEDLITALSRVRWLTVIARNSTFTYKGKAVDVKQVGREMGVRYVLEGSVRRAGNRVRITAQLIEAETGAHIWAERYDRQLDDIFELQDEITETITGAIEPEIGAAERERARAKPPGDLGAWDAYQRGLWYMYRYTAEDIAAARNLFEQAIALDPSFGPAHASLAYTHYADGVFGYTDDIEDSHAKGLVAARAAIGLDEKDPIAHSYLGRLYTQKGAYDAALSELDLALTLNPNFAMAHYGRGLALTFGGQSKEAIVELEAAMRLSPHDPQMWLFELIASMAATCLRDFEAGLSWARKSASHPQAGFYGHLSVAGNAAKLGLMDEANVAAAKVRELNPNFSVGFMRRTWPNLNEEAFAPLLEGMAMVGFEDSETATG